MAGVLYSKNDILNSTSSAGLFRSTDQGMSWEYLGFWGRSYSIVSIQNNLFVNDIYNGLTRSTDNGMTWENVYSCYLCNWNLVENDSIVFAYVPGGISIIRSVDYGNTWDTVNNGLTDPNVYSLIFNGFDLLAGTGAGVSHSSNNGNNWVYLGNLQNETFNFLATMNKNIFGVVPNNGVYRSKDNGNHWLLLNSGIQVPTEQGIGPFMVSGDKILLGTERTGVLLLSQNGNSWIDFNDGFTDPNLNIPSLQADKNYLYADLDLIRQGMTLWRRPISELNITNSNVSSNFSFSQSYPNPFPLSTTIAFDLPSYSIVSLKIMDALGKEVGTVLSREKLSAGHHEVQWNANELPNGVYFYHLIIDSFSETKKLILFR